MECAYHLPSLCDCGSLENQMEESLMPDANIKTDDKTKTQDDPEEEARFARYLAKAKASETPASKPGAESVPPAGQSQSAPPAAGSSFDIQRAVSSALDDREKSQKSEERIKGLETRVEDLTKRLLPKKRF